VVLYVVYAVDTKKVKKTYVDFGGAANKNKKEGGMTVEQVRTVHSTAQHSTVAIIDSPSPITTHISQFTCLAGHKIAMNSATVQHSQI
jgi:hypothetical protein